MFECLQGTAKLFLLQWKSCKACTDLFKCQEDPKKLLSGLFECLKNLRKAFLPQGRPCGARAGLFERLKGIRNLF